MTTFGLLGTGFLGKKLLEVLQWSPGSFITVRPGKETRLKVPSGLQVVPFAWETKETWNNLPDSPCTLLCTIPPVIKSVEEEEYRLKEWFRWIRRERKEYLKFIYISSTGVYPEKDGLWSEKDSITPDTSRGALRLMTENVVKQFYQAVIIRPGGIYGPGRNLGERILKGLAIPGSKKPVHRIHVDDLAGIIQKVLQDSLKINLINAVDMKPAPSSEIVEWLMTKPFFKQGVLKSPCTTKANWFSDRPETSVKRLVNNRILVNELGFTFKYPTYREGYAAIFSESCKSES